jgi:putative tryptophan/tyrosine transport system substrate-binding protein
MRRREFIAGLGSAAAWPAVTRAQQRPQPVIGFLHTGSPEVTPSLVAGFRQGLNESGFIDGRNVAIEFRWANNEDDRLPELAADLVRRGVDVIATPNTARAALAAKAATTTIPIVFNSTGAEDPVKLGLVASYNRPGGNATGVTSLIQELGSKRLGFLHELLPRATRFVLLVQEANESSLVGGANEHIIADVRAAASTLGFQVELLSVGSIHDIDTAFATLSQKRTDALLTAPSALFGARRLQLAMLAARYAVPAMYHDRLFTEAGGLMSYGTSLADMYRQVGVYTGRVLKGEKPADLPVLQPIKYELVINLQTARLLGLPIPPNLLAITDAVIE